VDAFLGSPCLDVISTSFNELLLDIEVEFVKVVLIRVNQLTLVILEVIFFVEEVFSCVG
jgi:hypothetical protein